MPQASDINLLPNQLRGREEKEKKTPKEQRVDLTDPKKNNKKDSTPLFRKIINAVKLFGQNIKQRKDKKTDDKKNTDQAPPPDQTAEEKLMELRVKTAPPTPPTPVFKRNEPQKSALPKPSGVFSRSLEKAAAPPKEKVKIIKEKVTTDGEKPTVAKDVKILTSDLEVNLVPEKEDITNLLKKRLIFFVSWVGSVTAVMLLLFGTFKFLSSGKLDETALVRDEISSIQHEIAELSSFIKTALDFQKSMTSIEVVLGKHLYWSNMIGDLELNTIGNVYYDDASFDLIGGITMGLAAKDWESFAQQLIAFEQANFVKEVKVTGASSDGEAGGAIRTRLHLIVNPEVLLQGEPGNIK